VYGGVPPVADTAKLPDEPAQMASVGGETEQASGATVAAAPRAKMVPVKWLMVGQELQSKVYV
jgi:hypothetical protein